MSLAAQIDELERRAWDLPKPVAIILVIFGFMIWWPIGLAALAYFIWSRGMSCGHHGADRWQHKMDRMQAQDGPHARAHGCRYGRRRLLAGAVERQQGVRRVSHGDVEAARG